MSEYKLSYTASEIDSKLGKVDKLVASVNGVRPDINGNVNINVSGGGSAIIDVVELPTENIREDVFYKVAFATFMADGENIDGWVCHVVNILPDVGEPVSTDMINITGYYNAQDREVYGYADSMISAVGGIPVGWYPIAVLGQAFNVSWGGAITDIDDMSEGSAYVLLTHDFYIYQNGWCKVPFAYEKAPKFDIQWDGVIGDRFALDVTAMSVTTTYMVKVSEQVLSAEQLIGGELFQVNGWQNSIEEECIDFNTFSGAFTIWGGGAAVVYNADEFGSMLGAPAGYITNGVYFVYVPDENNYTNRLVAPAKIIKIDSKYLDLGNIDVDIDLSEYTKFSDVQSLIASAIGCAIGGSY